ncbi:hypothetical protein MMC22_006887 [Lobaria immixta]|nr:hypothetical protein [Lobaria immixta]
MNAVVTSVTSVTETKTRSYTTSSSSTTTTSSVPTTTTSTSTNTTASHNTTSSSSGVKIGVGVGVTVGALIIIALALLWFLRRRRNKNQKIIDYGGPNAPHETEALKSPESVSELAHDRTTEIPAELSPGQNHPVEMDSGTGISHRGGAPNEQPVSSTSTNHSHGPPHESSSLPMPSPDLQRTVRPAFSTSSIVHPGLLDAAAAASRFLDRPSTAPTPAPSPEPSDQLARSLTQDGNSAPLSPDENPLMPFPPKSSSRSHLPPPLSANQPSSAVADRLNPPTSKRPFDSAPPTPKKSFQQIFSTAPKQPSIQVVPPTPRQTVKDLPSLPSAGSNIVENAPSTIKARLRNHPQPLQSNRPLSFASPPSRDPAIQEPYPPDFPLRSSTMAGLTVVDPNAANSRHQGSDPVGPVADDPNPTDFVVVQSTHDSNASDSSAPDSTSIRNYSHKITRQRSQQFWNGTSSAHVENMGMI